MFFKILIIFTFFISLLYSSVHADDSNYENLGLCISKVALKSKYESIQKMTFQELKDYRKRFEKGKEEGIEILQSENKNFNKIPGELSSEYIKFFNKEISAKFSKKSSDLKEKLMCLNCDKLGNSFRDIIEFIGILEVLNSSSSISQIFSENILDPDELAKETCSIFQDADSVLDKLWNKG